MKKIFKIVFLVVATIMILTSCKKSGLSPVKSDKPTKASDKMPDGTYHVGFKGDDLEKDGDDYYLTIEFFDYDRWDKAEFEKLKEGDKLKMHDQEVEVKAIYPSYTGDGTLVGYNINGEIEDGGFFFLMEDDDKTIRRTEWDNNYITYSIGKGKFKISKDVTLEDKTTLFNPSEKLRDDEIVHYGDLEDAIKGSEFIPNNTYVTLKDNEVIKIVQEWVP